MIDFFSNRKPNTAKLSAYGFSKTDDGFIYSTDIAEGQFLMAVSIGTDGDVRTKVTDKETDEEYILHLAAGSAGPFVGMVRSDYEAILQEISEKCFDMNVFKSSYAHSIIDYIRDKYGDKLEFLWKRFPDNAIWRRKDTNKWYGTILVISRGKLGLNSDDKVEIINLRVRPENLSTLIDNKKYFPGYHMCKTKWCTICLDGTVPIDEIYRMIDESYRLAVK